MDLSHPVRSLVPSLAGDVLGVLTGTATAMGVSQIARLAPRGTRMGISAVLTRLVDHGLVLADPANQGFVYRLNPDHLMTPLVRAAAAMRTTLLDRLTERLTALRPAPIHASVFGSFARAEAGVDSDIDLLIVGTSQPDVDDWEVQLDALGNDVLRWTGNRCQILPLTRTRVRRLRTTGEPIVDNWLDDGHLLAGVPLADLLDERHRSTTAATRATQGARR